MITSEIKYEIFSNVYFWGETCCCSKYFLQCCIDVCSLIWKTFQCCSVVDLFSFLCLRILLHLSSAQFPTTEANKIRYSITQRPLQLCVHVFLCFYLDLKLGASDAKKQGKMRIYFSNVAAQVVSAATPNVPCWTSLVAVSAAAGICDTTLVVILAA